MTFGERLSLYSERGHAKTHAAAAAARIVDGLWAQSSTQLAVRYLTCHGRRRDCYLPIRNYEALTASEVIRRIEALSPSQPQTVKANERTHQNRKALLIQVDRRRSGARR
jgi:hypothetical protein